MKMENANLELPENIHPQEKTTFLRHLNQSGIFLIGVAVLIILIVLGMVGYWFWVKPSVNIARQLQNHVNNNPTSIPLPSPKETAKVQYVKREKILELVKISGSLEATPDPNFDVNTFEFFKVGVVTTGKYKDWDLVLASITYYGPCKGAGCGKPMRWRYLKNGNAVVFLSKISYPFKPFGSDSFNTNINPFQKFGFTLTRDDNFTIHALEYPNQVLGSTKRQIITSSEYGPEEEDGELDTTKLDKVFTSDIFGDVYTTKPSLSPNKSFYDEIGWRAGAAGCTGEECFTTNGFYVFRPDGTFLKFHLNPSFSEKDISWSTKNAVTSSYLYNTISGCSYQKVDYISVVPPSIIGDTDLEIIGKITTTGDIIYGLKDINHPLYKDFYDTYKKYFIDWDSTHSQYTGEKHTLVSYEEFLAKLPVFFWRDPFGRLIRFNNTDFLPVQECEPIIYLYPRTSQQITVEVAPKGAITDSTPKYNDGWTVVANPNGTLVNTKDSRLYSYLFWEGWSSIFSMPKEGFVVKKAEIGTFLRNTLPLLGLNERETGDFLETWIPQLSTSPYYFITFINSNFIDLLAPLTITPKPDTVVRVLMDFKPLDEPIQVEPMQLIEPPQRKGFTVVEWGGLKRSD